jgi:hypothetical protein
MSRIQSKQKSLLTLRRITRKYCSTIFVSSKSFLDILRKHKFESSEDLEDALLAYCSVVLTRDLRNAIFITLPEKASIKTLNLQSSIARGMENAHLVYEFTEHGEITAPRWYLDAKKTLDVPI